ncbi:MAG: glycoside hydrolase family 81 [Verrucomicrobiaceae bacterium]|nr:glycoside hydrolase family 81 [Verrucomicrobiaceae bacterium]
MRSFLIATLAALQAVTLSAEILPLGKGSYTNAISGDFTAPPPTIYRTPGLKGPVPTNDWWSSVLWEPFSSNQFPHPLGVKCEQNGLRVSYPGAHKNAFDRGIISSIPASGNDLTIGLAETGKFIDARVDNHSDWFLTVQFGNRSKYLRCTYGHGSPFVYIETTGSAPALSFNAPPKIWLQSATTTAITTANGNHYGIFCPSPTKWEDTDTRKWKHSKNAGGFFSIALLPDKKTTTLKLFTRHAHAHVTDTHVNWRYDQERSKAIATFSITTKSRDGVSTTPLTALYPHQWRRTQSTLLPLSYHSVRGPMRLFAGKQFELTFDFPGILPCLPHSVEGITNNLLELLKSPKAPKDSYWGGKILGNLASGSAIASTCNNAKLTAQFQKRIKNELEDWLSFNGDKGDRHFFYDSNWGSLIGIPPSYGSSKELNDHHFHYGYFFRAAAEIARNDPSWLKENRWEAMLATLIDDVACSRRNDTKFPFLRNFDPYAGHSWASGHARFADGNNQESSSESMSAWTGLILLGEFTSNKPLRDLGIYLYSSELAAIEDYWFDVTGDNYPAAFTAPSMAMIWGGKSTYETWFSNAPHCKTGINLLPIHGGSLYLGRYPEFVEANHNQTLAASGGKWLGWPSIMISYRALTDADSALDDWKNLGKSPNLDSGNFSANVIHWIENLRQLGRVNRKVTCNQPLSATFKSKSGKITHVVYISGREPREVIFSDGTRFQALPGKFTIK